MEKEIELEEKIVKLKDEAKTMKLSQMEKEKEYNNLKKENEKLNEKYVKIETEKETGTINIKLQQLWKKQKVTF